MGKSWNRVTTPDGIVTDLQAVRFTGPLTGVTVGDGANVWRSADGSAGSEGGIGGTILRTEDGGRAGAEPPYRRERAFFEQQCSSAQ